VKLLYGAKGDRNEKPDEQKRDYLSEEKEMVVTYKRKKTAEGTEGGKRGRKKLLRRI